MNTTCLIKIGISDSRYMCYKSVPGMNLRKKQFSVTCAATVCSYLSRLTSWIMCAECDCFITKKRPLLCSVVCLLCFIPNTRLGTLIDCGNVRFVSSWSFQPLKCIHTSRSCDSLLKLVKRSLFLCVCFCEAWMQATSSLDSCSNIFL